MLMGERATLTSYGSRCLGVHLNELAISQFIVTGQRTATLLGAQRMRAERPGLVRSNPIPGLPIRIVPCNGR